MALPIGVVPPEAGVCMFAYVYKCVRERLCCRGFFFPRRRVIYDLLLSESHIDGWLHDHVRLTFPMQPNCVLDCQYSSKHRTP